MKNVKYFLKKFSLIQGGVFLIILLHLPNMLLKVCNLLLGRKCAWISSGSCLTVTFILFFTVKTFLRRQKSIKTVHFDRRDTLHASPMKTISHSSIHRTFNKTSLIVKLWKSWEGGKLNTSWRVVLQRASLPWKTAAINSLKDGVISYTMWSLLFKNRDFFLVRTLISPIDKLTIRPRVWIRTYLPSLGYEIGENRQRWETYVIKF